MLCWCWRINIVAVCLWNKLMNCMPCKICKLQIQEALRIVGKDDRMSSIVIHIQRLGVKCVHPYDFYGAYLIACYIYF